MEWQPLNLESIPEISGVYGFRHHEQWLYVGKAKNLAKRLTKYHPALNVARSLAMSITYWYQASDTGMATILTKKGHLTSNSCRERVRE